MTLVNSSIKTSSFSNSNKRNSLYLSIVLDLTTQFAHKQDFCKANCGVTSKSDTARLRVCKT